MWPLVVGSESACDDVDACASRFQSNSKESEERGERLRAHASHETASVFSFDCVSDGVSHRPPLFAT